MNNENRSVKCSFCDSKNLVKIIDFGRVGLAGAFLSFNQIKNEIKYPLRICFCEDCFAVQVIDKIDPDILFSDYFYFSSSIKTLSDHFETLADLVTNEYLSDPKESTVIEFGCNDGVLLEPLAKKSIKNLIGIDPASNVVKKIDNNSISIINNFFNDETANEIIDKYGKADLILANNVYAHIYDMKEVTRSIYKTLKDDGIFIFEVHYLEKIISEFQYDMIYHEHLYYHSILSLRNHFDLYDMGISKVERINTHGGSIRVYASKKISSYMNNIDQSVEEFIKLEISRGYQKKEKYINFANAISDQKNNLLKLINTLKAQGFSLAGYGASGRANTILQFCKINSNHLDYIIDDAPAKEGFYTPGSHILIKSRQVISHDPPDYIIIFAWSFIQEIAKKNNSYLKKGGKFILPLPNVRIISSIDEI